MKFFNFNKDKRKNNNGSDESIQSPLPNSKLYAQILISKNNRTALEERVDPSSYSKEAPFYTLEAAQNYLLALSEYAAEFQETNLSIKIYENNVNGTGSLYYDFVCALSTTYEDFLKLVFEDIFNNPANNTTSYSELAEFAQQLKQEYASETGKSESTLVEIPSQSQAEENPTTIQYPEDDYSDNFWGDLQGGYSEETDTNDLPQDNNYPELAGSYEEKTSNEPKQEDSEETINSQENYNRSQMSKITSRMLYDPEYIKSRLNVSDNLGLFTVSDDLPEKSVDDTSPDYVKINDNNNRKELNERIKRDVIKMENTFVSPLIEHATELDNSLDDELSKWEDENKPTDDIYKDVNELVESEKNNRIEEINSDIEASKQVELKSAKQEYDTKVSQITDKFKNKLNSEISKANREFNDTLQDEKQKVYDKATKLFEDEKEKVYTQLLSSKKNDLEKAIMNAREMLLNGVEDIMNSAQEKLQDSKDKLNKEYYHNLQIKNEEEAQRHQRELKEQQEAELARHNKANEENEKNSQKALQELAQSQEKIMAQLVAKNEVSKNDDKFSNLIDLMLVREMERHQGDNQSVNDEKINEKVQKALDENKMRIEALAKENAELVEKNEKTQKKNKHILVGAITFIILALGGATGAVAYNHNWADGSTNSKTDTSVSASSASSSNSTRPVNTTPTANKPKVSDYDQLLNSKKYNEAASKYPDKLNDIETHIYHNKDIDSLNKFNQVYSVRFGYLDTLLLQKANAQDIYDLIAQFKNLNFKDKKRAEQVGKKMLKLNKIDVARIINSYQPSTNLSKAIASHN